MRVPKEKRDAEWHAGSKRHKEELIFLTAWFDSVTVHPYEIGQHFPTVPTIIRFTIVKGCTVKITF